MNSNAGSRENIKVVCRMRPLNDKEIKSGKGVCITNSSESLKLMVEPSGDKKSGEEGVYDFTFDKVFGPETQQYDVFNFAAKPIIEGALEGWNGTLFCYGQTSSGKTHTMEGVHNDAELKGVIPRMMEYVFELIQNANVDLEFSVKCSFLEIYNEKIQDLLDPRKNNLMVKEEKSKGIWVDDATEIYVTTKDEMHDVFKVGSENRSVGATQMNAKSSRSHSLFIVTIFQKNNKTDSTKTGKLYFVDLAGSERMTKTGIEGGQMLEEAKNINKSLLMLGMVINALTEGRTHVPYRDSKLTRVLQESLGGNSQTTLIINCSMCAINSSESLSTLRFGQRAKSIKNKIVVNTERSAKELLMKLNAAEDKIRNFENIIKQLQNGGEIHLQSILINNLTPTNNDIITPSDNLNNPINSSKNNKITTHTNDVTVPNSHNTTIITDSNRIEHTTSSLKSCEDCANATRNLLNQHIEFVSLQEELENVKKDKLELEEEISLRNQEIYQLNERTLLYELKAKYFIEDELKSFQELQMRLEHLFLLNQNKLLQTNKIRNMLEKTRYEIIIMMKSNKYKLDKIQLEGLSEELISYNKNLEDSLEVLNTIEEYIINDNKNFNSLVDLISGKNIENDNIPIQSPTHIENMNNNIDVKNNSTNIINNINFNINENININIVDNNPKERTRRNSISYTKSEIKLNNTNTKKEIKMLTNKSCVPEFKNSPIKRNNYKYLSAKNNITPIKIDDDSFVDPNLTSYTEETKDINSNKINKILKHQRKTITNLASKYKSIEEALSSVKKENFEKELILNQNTENFHQTESKLKEYELIISELNDKLIKKGEEYEEYKAKSMRDFVYKEKKIIELINKVSDLEDENYKLIHFNKDKDKKKYFIVEKQVKELTNEMQKLIEENSKLKKTIDKKEDEMKNLYSKITDLENRLVQSLKYKMNEISFSANAPELQSGTCTPITNYLNAKGFQCTSLGDILRAKLKTLSSISPKSVDEFKSVNNSTINFNPNMVGNSNRENSSNKLYHVNIHSNTNCFNMNNNQKSNTNSPNNATNNNRIIRIIRGGGGKDYNSNQNFFFSKMLNSSPNIESVKRQLNSGIKINLNQFKKDKIEQEFKYLDGDDDINISKDHEILDNLSHINSNRAKTPQKEKGGLLNFFSKIISK